MKIAVCGLPSFAAPAAQCLNLWRTQSVLVVLVQAPEGGGGRALQARRCTAMEHAVEQREQEKSKKKKKDDAQQDG